MNPDNNENNPTNNENLNQKKVLRFKEADEKETGNYIKILKRWLLKYNKLDSESVNLNTEEKLNDFEFNSKLNFLRIKIFIDFLEMMHLVPNIAQSVINDFPNFSKFTKNLTRKVLLASNKINKETSIYTDLIMLNFPFIHNSLNSESFSQISSDLNPSKGRVIAFNKAHVLKINPPSFLLWSKKIFHQCLCIERKYTQKFYNIYNPLENEKVFNNNTNENFCPSCRKNYFQDKNSDIYIECQEIILAIPTEKNRLINNIFSLWVYGDFINSVKECSAVTLIAFYMPNPTNAFYEKKFEYGKLIALNINFYLSHTLILKENCFTFETQKNSIDSIFNKNKFEYINKSNENKKEVLKSVKFHKQLNSNILKMFFSNFLTNLKLRLTKNLPIENFNSFNPLLCLALELSIIQRDFLLKANKIALFNNGEIKLDNKINSNIEKKNEYSNYLNSKSNSRNILFKSKIFENNKKENQATLKNEVHDEIRKHFRLSKQIDFEKSFSSEHELLIKPFNLFLILDYLEKENNLLYLIQSYAKIYPEIVFIYPYFYNTNGKFNKDNLLNFLISCNNGILIIPDIDILSKGEIDLISLVTCSNSNFVSNNNKNMKNSNSNLNLNLNISFWFLADNKKLSSQQNKKSNSLFDFKIKNFEQIINKCDIILNFSKRFNYSRGFDLNSKFKFESDLEEKIHYEGDFSMLTKSELDFNQFKNFIDIKILDKINPCRSDHFIDYISDQFNDSLAAAKLMEDYFIFKRNVCNVNFDDLFLILRLSTLVSFLRCHQQDKTIPFSRTVNNLNYVDVVLTIFYFEELSVFKYGIESSSFGTIIPKIMLYNYSEDFVHLINTLKSMANFFPKKNQMIQEESFIPLTKNKNSLKKISLNESNNRNNEENKNCSECNYLLSLKTNFSLEEFLEKLEKLES